MSNIRINEKSKKQMGECRIRRFAKKSNKKIHEISNKENGERKKKNGKECHPKMSHMTIHVVCWQISNGWCYLNFEALIRGNFGSQPTFFEAYCNAKKAEADSHLFRLVDFN